MVSFNCGISFAVHLPIRRMRERIFDQVLVFGNFISVMNTCF